MSKLIDMTGWVMAEHGVPNSRLTIIKRVENTKNGRVQWLCECNCEEHNKVIAIGTDIRNGHVLSCGCLRKENMKKIGEQSKKYNLYDLSGEYGIGWTSNTNREFYFDLEDYDKIKDYCWFETADTSGYHYLVAKERGTHINIKMSNLIAPKNYDHKDRNPFNNRKCNLRKATSVENSRNRSIGKNNTSGIIGVYFDNYFSRWIAQINLNKKHIRIGYFHNKEDAIKARLQAEADYYGEFAPQKHLFEQYKIN